MCAHGTYEYDSQQVIRHPDCSDITENYIEIINQTSTDDSTVTFEFHKFLDDDTRNGNIILMYTCSSARYGHVTIDSGITRINGNKQYITQDNTNLDINSGDYYPKGKDKRNIFKNIFR